MVRYDTKRNFGGKEPETRREYNLRFGQDPGPEAQPPSVVGHVWGWFWSLARRRQTGVSSSQPISFSEIKSWEELMGEEVRPPEVEMLLAMDDAYLQAESAERDAMRERDAVSKPKSKAGRLF